MVTCLHRRSIPPANRWSRYSSFSRRQPFWRVARYGLAVVAVAVAFGLRLALEAGFGPGLPPFITFYPAVMLVALLAGVGPCLTAIALAGPVACYWIMPPVGRFAVTSPVDRLGLAVFTGMALFMGVVAEFHRRNRDQVAAYEREMALRHGEERLALAASATRIGMFDLDVTRNRVLWTQAHEAIFGYAPATTATTSTTTATTAEHDNRRWSDRVHPDDLPLVEEESRRCMQERKPLELQYRIVWPDGSLHWVETRGVFQYDGDGKADRMLGVVMDITERKQADAALRESEDQYRTLADSIPHLAWWANGDGFITWYNRRWYEYTGTTPEQMEGWGWQSVHDPKVLTKVLDRWKASIATGEPFEMVFPLRGGDGVFRPFLTRVMPLCQDGKVVRWFGTNTDISERERVEAALRQSEERYRYLFDSMIEGFCIIEVLFDAGDCPTDYRFLEINPAFEAQTGLRNAQGKLMRELAPEHEAHWFEIYGKVALTGEPTRFVNEAKMLNRWYEVSAYRVGGRDSRKVAILFNDISEAKRDEVALRESERRYSALFANKINGMAHCRTITDEHGQPVDYVILQVNEAHERIIGVNKAEVEGRRVTEVFPDIKKYALDYIGIYGKIALEGGETKFEEYFEATGQCLSIYAYCPLRGEFIAIFTDVTKRKRAEETLKQLTEELEIRVAQRTAELEENRDQLEEQTEELAQSLNSLEEEVAERQRSEERLRLLIDGTKDHAVFMIGTDGSVINWNEGAKRLKGWDEQEILGRHFSLFYTEEDLAAGTPERELGLAVTEGRHEVVGWRAKKDGSKFMADVVITALRDDSGRLRGFAKVTRDITERVQAQEALREKEHMLIQQSRQAAMGEMIGNIAHQWRQPLNTLGLTIQAMKLYYDHGQFTKEFLDKSVGSSMDLIRHMSQTIEDFRNYFRPDHEKTRFKGSEAIAKTLWFVEDSFRNQHIGVEIVTESDPIIYGFPNEFAQVLLNILINAKDALTERQIEDPKVTILIGNEGGLAVITVADNAGGIPEEIVTRIFDPYFTTKGPQTGTGIGLFMSKSIIEKNMGGRLTVRNIGDGAEFRIEV